MRVPRSIHLSVSRFAALAAAALALLAVLACGAAEAAGRRVALVVGVANYQAVSPLRNTINDSIRVAATLERLGFEVTRVADPQRGDFVKAIRDFGANAKDAEASVFFYAGHALEVSGRNWLLPVDARLESALDLRLEALDVDAVLDRAQLAHTAIMFLDACRNNPFAEKLAGETRGGGSRGLARIDPVSGVLVAFATAPGQVALDGNGVNSPFTEALLKYIETPGLEIRQLMSRVRADVRQSTRDQVPWEQSALEGDFYFVDPVKVALPAPPPAPAPPVFDPEALFWDTVRASSVAVDFEAYLLKYPQGTYAGLARNRIAALQALAPVSPVKPPAAPPKPAPASAAVPPTPFTPDVAAQEPSPSPAPSPAPAARPAPASIAAAPAPAAETPAAPPPVIAAQPAPPPAAPIAVAAVTPVPNPAAMRAELVRQLELQLKMLGCFSAETNEDWNGELASAAVTKLNLANPGKNLLGEPSEALLTRLSAKDVKACEPDCKRGFAARGGACVRVSCDKGEIRNARGLCIEPPQAQEPVRPRPPRHVARPPVIEEPPPVRARPREPRRAIFEPPAPRPHRPPVVRAPPAPRGGGGGGGACFTVDGRQYCS